MTTINELLEKLAEYPKDMEVKFNDGKSFIHIAQVNNTVILSTTKPIGNCTKCGNYCYPTTNTSDDYVAYCPTCDEDLYKFEVDKFYEITSYYIDENHVLHTWIGNVKHVTISDVYSIEEAESIIDELNDDLNN